MSRQVGQRLGPIWRNGDRYKTVKVKKNLTFRVIQSNNQLIDNMTCFEASYEKAKIGNNNFQS